MSRTGALRRSPLRRGSLIGTASTGQPARRRLFQEDPIGGSSAGARPEGKNRHVTSVEEMCWSHTREQDPGADGEGGQRGCRRREEGSHRRTPGTAKRDRKTASHLGEGWGTRVESGAYDLAASSRVSSRCRSEEQGRRRSEAVQLRLTDRHEGFRSAPGQKAPCGRSSKRTSNRKEADDSDNARQLLFSP